MIEFALLAQEMFNTPLAIHPRKAEIAMAALAEKLGITQLVRANGQLVTEAMEDDEVFVTSSSRSRSADPGYDLVAGVAIIPVSGTLAQKTRSLRPYSGMTGYDGIRQAFLTARADEQVRAIALDIQSGGGAVAGLFDLVDTIHAARGDKPIAAILSEVAYSAAYVLASAVDPGRIYVPRTGGTGSNGCICMHVDMSKAITQAGLKVTFITSEGADRKTDGHSEIPLSADAYDAIKADVDAMGDLLHETVGRNRGLAASKVRGQQAATFMGAAGITAGLADAVMAPDAAFRALLAEIA
ncbi:S49 family peptidase [Sphingomonas sp. CBMAI 2297]|uniref:S49 family peptidase n=1 Tax=Sphingomonas sp. CBMAI 2297 TaxID=2991720 RepID=UPI0024561B25|nr:S49 family peptidase [Sphingomonas sp. CBMAI 2297]MDH4745832.1 S49 family peptidase [Sphingomonas sp. CBMAI 2297]